MTSLMKYCNESIGFPTQFLEKSGVSEEGIAFITRLFIAVPENRETAANALKSPWLTGYTDHWLQNLEAEFSKLGAYLDPAKMEDPLLRKVGKVDIMQYLPTTPAEMFPALLLQAVRKGYNSATTMLLQPQSRELIDPSTRGMMFRSAVEDGYAETIKILVHYKMDIGARTDGETVLK